MRQEQLSKVVFIHSLDIDQDIIQLVNQAPDLEKQTHTLVTRPDIQIKQGGTIQILDIIQDIRIIRIMLYLSGKVGVNR